MVKLERLLEVGESLFFRFTLARDIDFQALGDVPISLLPNSRGKLVIHVSIFSRAALRSASLPRLASRTYGRSESRMGRLPSRRGSP